MHKLLQSLVDEDEADEGSEGLFCETGNVTNQGTRVCSDQNETQEGRPQADTGTKRQVRQIIVSTRTERERTQHMLNKNALDTVRFYPFFDGYCH